MIRTGGYSRRVKFWIAIVTIGCLAVLFVMAWHYGGAARRRMASHNSFKAVWIALDEFETPYGRLPSSIRYADGIDKPFSAQVRSDQAPLYSWRFAVHHFVTGNMSKQEVAWDQSWDSPVNRKFHRLYSPYTTGIGNETHIGAVVGTGTAFGEPGETPHTLSELPAWTIILIELAEPIEPWCKPGDFDIGELPDESTCKSLCRPDRSWFTLCFACGEIWSLRDETPLELIRPYFSCTTTPGDPSPLREYRIQ